LLEWIDAWYQDPPHAGDRRLGKWRNAVTLLSFFEEVAPRVYMKGFGVEGDSLPQKHGEFNNCAFWRADFRDPAGPLTFPRD
jgi:hypothetical protein